MMKFSTESGVANAYWRLWFSLTNEEKESKYTQFVVDRRKEIERKDKERERHVRIRAERHHVWVELQAQLKQERVEAKERQAKLDDEAGAMARLGVALFGPIDNKRAKHDVKEFIDQCTTRTTEEQPPAHDFKEFIGSGKSSAHDFKEFITKTKNESKGSADLD
jgi:hypothetical protein